jgi:hypothetical protein
MALEQKQHSPLFLQHFDKLDTFGKLIKPHEKNIYNSSDLYYKNIMIIRMTIVSDAPSSGVTYDHRSDV